jgi:hypothetical protein
MNMINGEQWLKNGISCKLTVIPCSFIIEKWNTVYLKTFSNLPNDQSINLYASLCFFEGTNVSVGRGTEKQFQIYGPLFTKSNFSFVPINKNPVYNGITCFGEDLSSQTEVRQLELKWLIKAYNNTTDKSKFLIRFHKTSWNTQLQQQIETGEEIWNQKELEKA